MSKIHRGIAPDLLLSQVKNTMPYLFENAEKELASFPPAELLRRYEEGDPKFETELSHFEYFRLCLSCHYLTCATPVPTDVDNQIRKKLWPRELPLETALEMSSLILESRHWDFSKVSSRTVAGLSGHLGEWFTVAAGAYSALGQYSSREAQQRREALLGEIEKEVEHHSEIFGSLWREEKGLEALKASASIAHNFGDLDRVMDMWELGANDGLRLRFYKLGSAPFDENRKLRYLGRLWTAGELYKSTIDGSSMALENHRHFALRKPRSLRTRREFLIPTGPFFDDWGKTVAQGIFGPEDLSEVVTNLVQGWLRLPKTVGYGRALRSIFSEHPDLEKEHASELTKAHRQVLGMRQEVFEKKWASEAVRLMDDIPSRAS